ncbi:MAG TPA: hypothetical protein VEX38_06470, partial [Fimbriimonadaceae bacterium]|nr:hypothetical protein [Fimbriimonadaceae bacterium]
MSTQIAEASKEALVGALELLSDLALPIALLLAVLIARATALRLMDREAWEQSASDQKAKVAKLTSYALAAVVVLTAWSALRMLAPLARQSIAWERSAEATANPSPDAPPVYQFGPSVGVLREKTYTRTLTLPPYMVERIGSEGIGVLAPYLSDPSAENVLKLVDTFRRSGADVVFTRELTRMDEEPIAFDSTDVKVQLKRVAGQAFDAGFSATYAFRNETPSPVQARFVFPLPMNGGTIRDLRVSVGDQSVQEPSEAGSYEWSGSVAPGETRKAVVSFRVLGGRSFTYDIGSTRRRVKQFKLVAEADGAVRYSRGSIQPTSQSGNRSEWNLPNVLTAQRINLTLPPDTAGTEAYVQALSVMPLAFVVFAVGAALWLPSSRRQLLPAALIVFALGLGSSLVIAVYAGPAAGVLLAGALAT